MKPTTDDMLGAAEEFVGQLQRDLLPRVGAEDVSETAKIPFNVVMCREVLARRFLELARVALDALGKEQFAATAVVTRSVVETGAALWYLGQAVEGAVRGGTSAELKERVFRLLHGSRTTPEAPSAINVLTFIDAADKQVEGVRHSYDRLSEMAHPNWAGTLYLFGRPNREARACVFGPSADVNELSFRTGAVLGGTCYLVGSGMKTISEHMPALVAMCERELGAA